MLDFLSARVFGVPVIFVIIAGGVVVAIFAPKLLAKFTGNSASSSTNLGGTTADAAAVTNGTIDPNTGVPYNIESQTDPNTGVPFYYEQAGNVASSGANTTPTGGNTGGSGSAGTYNPVTDIYATQKANAIQAWVAKWGKPWPGPPGSYPSGWLTGNIPGAYNPNNNTFVIPLSPTGYGVAAGMGRVAPVRWPYARIVRE